MTNFFFQYFKPPHSPHQVMDLTSMRAAVALSAAAAAASSSVSPVEGGPRVLPRGLMSHREILAQRLNAAGLEYDGINCRVSCI